MIGIKSFPSIPQNNIQLQALCLVEDEDKVHRERFIQTMRDIQFGVFFLYGVYWFSFIHLHSIRIEQDATEIVENMIENIPEHDPLMDNLPKSFCQQNRDHKVMYFITSEYIKIFNHLI